MKAFVSLRWKILAWFFVNLAVIGGAVFWFLRAQFKFGVDSLLAGPTGDRLEAIARPLAADLRTASLQEYSGVLDRAMSGWRERGVRATLFRNDGTFLTGDVPSLPAEVAEHVLGYGRKRGGLGPRGGGRLRDGGPGPGEMRRGGRPPPEGFGEGPPPFPPEADPDGPPPVRAREGPFRGGSGLRFRGGREEPGEETTPAPGPLEKFMVTTGRPQLYWAGVHLDSTNRRGMAPLPLTLVLVADSLRGGGLFFDYVPWLWIGGALLLITVLLWLPFVHNLTRSLRRLTSTAENIARGDFTPPGDSRRRDELGRLQRAHRNMAAQLDGFVAGQKRFLGDTAHELLTPLARMEVGLSILEHRVPDQDRSYAEKALREIRHMSDLVQSLLSFTRAGFNHASAERVAVPLARIVQDAVAGEAAAAVCRVQVPEGLSVLAVPDLLTRAVANVVRNALRYAGQDGPVHLTATVDGGLVTLSIADEGPGVPPEFLDRLFDPFFRPDTARARETGGTGLGLAIVKSAVEACGGTVQLQNRQPSGLQVDIMLPAAETGK